MRAGNRLSIFALMRSRAVSIAGMVHDFFTRPLPRRRPLAVNNRRNRRPRVLVPLHRRRLFVPSRRARSLSMNVRERSIPPRRFTSQSTFRSSVYILGPVVSGRIIDPPCSTPVGYTDPKSGADKIGTDGSTPRPPAAVGGKLSSAGTTPYEAGGRP